MGYRHYCMGCGDECHIAIPAQEALFPAFMSIIDNVGIVTVRAFCNDCRFSTYHFEGESEQLADSITGKVFMQSINFIEKLK